MKRPFRNYSQKPEVKKGVPSNFIKTHNFNEMKRHKHLFLIFFGLILISLKVSAENPEGRFRINEGDWFEMLVNNNQMSYLLRYQLEKQMDNNNQQYKITIEHFSLIDKKDNGLRYAYDSYYPEFDESKTTAPKKIGFILKTNSAGNIASLTPSQKTDEKQWISVNTLQHIKNKNVSGYRVNINHLTNLKAYSETILRALNKSNAIGENSVVYLKETSIPLFIQQTELNIKLINASFPIGNNTLIGGKLEDMKGQDISINAWGAKYFFPEMKFKVNNDGTFSCNIFLQRPLHLTVRVGNRELTTFMEPGDTLSIFNLGPQFEFFLDSAGFTRKKPYKFFLPSLKKEAYFNGKAAYNTILSNEIDQYKNDLSFSDSLKIDEKKVNSRFNSLIEKYRDKVSSKCIDYFQLDWNYFVWNRKFKHFITTDMYLNQDEVRENAVNFSGIDSVPLLGNPYEWNMEYNSFISNMQQLKRLNAQILFEYWLNYNFDLATLSGYPLYKQLTHLLTSEAYSEYMPNDPAKSLYQSFMTNCTDPALTESLAVAYESITKLESGKTFPMISIPLADHSTLELNKFKGKAICLLFLYGAKTNINKYKEVIDKFDPEEVHFIIARHPVFYGNEDHADTEILKKPNVTYVEFSEDQLLKTTLLLSGTKIFILDKWLRIADNNITVPSFYNSSDGLEKAIQKAIQTKRFSKQQKASFLKTAGWSLGSILFTLLIGLWIYKVRVRNLKKREAIKRQIKELEIKAIRSQMNPHFVFNALNSIQSLVNSNQYKETNIYLAKFSVLLRGVLNNSEKSRVTLSDELEAVKLYCELEQLRFEFELTFEVDPDLDSDLIEIPGMIIQPLAENAVVHGLAPLGNKGLLQIKINRCSEGLCVYVSDNGVGLPDRTEDKLREKGYGLKLVEERIAILSQKNKKARLKLESNSEGQGTTATLIIPIDNV